MQIDSPSEITKKRLVGLWMRPEEKARFLELLKGSGFTSPSQFIRAFIENPDLMPSVKTTYSVKERS
jgi:hypothetical protein